MDMSVPWPQGQGEWLAAASAALTVLIGLFSMFAPRLRLRVLGLALAQHNAFGLGATRGSLAGFPLGIGVASLLLAQPFVYLALGLCWAFAAFGRLISILSDGSGGPRNWAMLAAEMALAATPLIYALSPMQ